VSVKETAWIPTLFLTEGQLEAEYDTIPAGTSQSFTFTVTPKNTAEGIKIPDTVVTYIATEGGKPVTSKAATKEMYVFSSADILKYKLLGYGSTATFGILKNEGDWIKTIAIIGGAGVVYMILGAYTKTAQQLDKSKRLRAQKALGLAGDELKAE
jgi:Translocon-associated protein beta (TRAPB)